MTELSYSRTVHVLGRYTPPHTTRIHSILHLPPCSHSAFSVYYHSGWTSTSHPLSARQVGCATRVSRALWPSVSHARNARLPFLKTPSSPTPRQVHCACFPSLSCSDAVNRRQLMVDQRRVSCNRQQLLVAGVQGAGKVTGLIHTKPDKMTGSIRTHLSKVTETAGQ